MVLTLKYVDEAPDQMKDIEQYFHVVLFVVILTFKFVDESLACATIQMKGSEQYFHVVLLIIWCEVVLISQSASPEKNQTISYFRGPNIRFRLYLYGRYART